MCALLDHRRSHRLSVPGDLALLVFATRGQQLRVQLREIPRLGHRHPVVPAKIAGLIFDSALGLSYRMQLVRLMSSDLGFG
jgi:hypothetical protein